jgi:hypothetical protein
MLLRALLTSLILLVALPLGWRLLQSPVVQAWWSPPPPPRPIVFDNGSVREPRATSGAGAQTVSPGLKKCRQGERLLYTDGPCPPGSRPEAVGGTVNVVTLPKPAAKPASAPAGLPTARTLLQDPGPTLREQHLERSVERMR